MNYKFLVSFTILLVVLFCSTELNGAALGCDCGWASRGCGRNDGSRCWIVCCDKRRAISDILRQERILNDTLKNGE